MLTKIKQFLDPQPKGTRREMSLAEKEIQQLEKENEALREKITILQNENKIPRIHVEYFYYHAQTTQSEPYSEKDLDRLPVMGITLHFMEEHRPQPIWLNAILSGLERTLQTMNVPFRHVNEPQLYSLFVDTKRYPGQEVRRVLQLAIKQLNELHWQKEDAVTVRVHVGGDELYEQLLAAYEEHAVG